MSGVPDPTKAKATAALGLSSRSTTLRPEVSFRPFSRQNTVRQFCAKLADPSLSLSLSLRMPVDPSDVVWPGRDYNTLAPP